MSIFGIDWNGNGKLDFVDEAMDFMFLNEFLDGDEGENSDGEEDDW